MIDLSSFFAYASNALFTSVMIPALFVFMLSGAYEAQRFHQTVEY